MTTISTVRSVTVLFLLLGVVLVSDAQERRRTDLQAKQLVDRVLRTSPIIDGHNDLFAWYYGCEYKKLAKCPNDIDDYPLDVAAKGHTDIPRWRRGGVGGVQLSVDADSLSNLLGAYDLLYRIERRYSTDLKVVSTSAEMRSAMTAGKIAILPMLEGSDRLEDKLSMLRTFYRLGLRCMTLTYTTSNLADGSDDEPKNNGVSDLGRQVIGEMNALGIIVDMSHISAKAMSDVLDVTTAPVIFSHSNSRAVCDVNRNVPDDILLRLKRNGGIIMIDMAPEHTSNLFARWMKEGDDLWYETKQKHPDDKKLLGEVMARWEKDNPVPRVSVGEVADHFDHVKRLIGVDHIGISGDYDGIDYVIDGLEDVSRFPNLLAELARRGWSEKELRKITGENFLRVFAGVEAASTKQR